MISRLALTVVAAASASPLMADPVTVHASNAILSDFARIVGGEDVRVTMPVPEGIDPAQWQPDIPDISAMQNADLILLNGVDYEGWASRVSLPRARTVQTTRGMEAELIRLHGHSHRHGDGPEHTHEGVASNVWMDFSLAASQAEAIATALSRARPEAAERFAENLADLQIELTELDAEAKEIGAEIAGQPVLALQPGYEYFERAYGLTVVEVTFDDVVPATSAQLAALDHVLSETSAKIMLWQAPPPADTATAIAERGVTIVVFETGANPAVDVSFTDLMRGNLAQLREAAQSR